MEDAGNVRATAYLKPARDINIYETIPSCARVNVNYEFSLGAVRAAKNLFLNLRRSELTNAPR